MNKKVVQDVVQKTFSYMEARGRKSNGLDVKHVQGLIFGRKIITRKLERKNGFSFGLERATVLGKYASYRDTAALNSTE